MEHAFAFSLALCAGLNFADGIVTLEGVGLPGIRESNPLARLALKSPPAFLAFKALSSYVIYRGLGALFKMNRTLSWIAVLVLNAAFSYAIVHNLRLIGEIK